MRLIPIIKDLSPANKEKCKWIRKKQGDFLRAIVSSEVFDITNIDGQAVGLNGRTLRDLILAFIGFNAKATADNLGKSWKSWP
jgi:hypothetical protein